MFIVLSVTVYTAGYICLFRGDQIFMDFVSFLSMIIYEVLYTWSLRYNICGAWFLDTYKNINLLEHRIFYRLLIAVPLKMYIKFGRLKWILKMANGWLISTTVSLLFHYQIYTLTNSDVVPCMRSPHHREPTFCAFQSSHNQHKLVMLFYLT